MTSHSESAAKLTKKAKNKPTSISGLIPGWDKIYKASSKASNRVTIPVINDDSMVQFVGMVSNEENDDHEHMAVISTSSKSSKKGTLVYCSTIFFINIILTSQIL